MVLTAASDKIQIGRLRVRGKKENSLAMRLALARLLENTDFRIGGIPPSAVLIVRNMADPLPGRVVPYLRIPLIDGGWERAARNSLAELYSHAARPSQGLVPASAEAVVFADQAELLACFVSDLIQEDARERWWWRVLLRGLPYPATDAVTRLLCGHAIHVPAALHHLAVRGQAITVVAALSSEQAQAIVMAVSRAYAVPFPDLRQHFFDPPPSAIAKPEGIHGIPSLEADQIDELNPQQEPMGAIAPALAIKRPDRAAPWDRWLPVGLVPTDVAREKACLLGVGLTLYRAPAAVRSEAFLQKLHDWWKTPSTAFPLPLTRRPPFSHTPTQDSSPSYASGQDALPNRIKLTSEAGLKAVEDHTCGSITGITAAQKIMLDGGSLVGDPPHPNPLPPGEREYCKEFTDPSGTLPAGTRVAESERGQEASDNPSPVVETAVPSTAAGNAPETLVEPRLSESIQQEIQPGKCLFFEAGVETQLGGVLYLINLMAKLDLPGCFEEEWGLASTLGAWGILDALGRGLIEGVDEPLGDDPLWQVLAELVGRETNAVPGIDFCGSESFSLPLDWPRYLTDARDGGYAWGTDGQRLRLWSEQGYVLREGLRTNLPATAQAAQELRRYGGDAYARLYQQPYDEAPIAKLSGPLVASPSPALRRWLALVLPYVRLRLQRALGLPNEGQGLAEVLLLHRGRLYVTSTHVDLVLSLDEVSISIRMAGLDRDPGWMPDFGRVVLFHYE